MLAVLMPRTGFELAVFLTVAVFAGLFLGLLIAGVL